MYEELTRFKKLNETKLNAYGFRQMDGEWKYACLIMEGEFSLEISVNDTGNIDTDLTENATGEKYILYKTNASGAFIGEIRTEIETVLKDIVNRCYEPEIFKSDQAQLLKEYISEMYLSQQEFLWEKLPDAAIWRRNDNDKWFGVIMAVKRGKIDGSGSVEMVEVVDLRMEKEKKDIILAGDHYYPGWHMNKNSWFSVILDGSVSDEELKGRVDESFVLAGDKNSYEKIYEVVCSIPEGKVATYGQVARLAGNKKWSRVVGYALHVNPKPQVIPCHRVVNSKGEVSPAFAFGGENRQIALLEAEGVEFSLGRVDLERFQWDK